jgi:hypothetical protein
MVVLLIVSAYLIVAAVEILALVSRKKKGKEIAYYSVFMFLSMIISIVIATNEDIPSIASIIRSVLSPIIKK